MWPRPTFDFSLYDPEEDRRLEAWLERHGPGLAQSLTGTVSPASEYLDAATAAVEREGLTLETA